MRYPPQSAACESVTPVSCMITDGSDGMMIPKPTLSMNTDSRMNVRAAREEVKTSSGKLRAAHCPAYVTWHASLHPDSVVSRSTHHGPDRHPAAGDRARATVAALRRARSGRLPRVVRQDLAHPVRPAAAHVAPAQRGRGGPAGSLRPHLGAGG